MYDIIFWDGRLIATGALASGNAVLGEVYDDIPNLDLCIAVLDLDGDPELVFLDGGGVQTALGLDMNASKMLACAIWGDEDVQLGGNDFTGAGYDIFIAKMDLSEVLSAAHTIQSDRALHVYPNPASEVLHISHSAMPYVSLRLLDVRGQVCLDITGRHTIDISWLPSGTYFLHAIGEQEQWVRKVEIAH